jgi:hypothetical protein
LFGIFAVVALVVPGIVYATIRTSLQGYKSHDRVLGERVLLAVLVSVGFDGVYLIVFGWWVAPLVQAGHSVLVKEPVGVGFAALILGLGLPALLAYLRYGNAPLISGLAERLRQRAPAWLEKLTPVTGFNSAPTAWDWVAMRQGGTWIRILTADDRWVGGWFADDSFVGLYPEPRDIFIRYQYEMTTDGSFGDPATDGAGVWLSLETAKVVEWTIDPESETPNDSIE